jgi:hypothetical protein
MSKIYSSDIFQPVSVLTFHLKDSTVSITDKCGGAISFSAQLTPEVVGTLQDIERNYFKEL